MMIWLASSPPDLRIDGPAFAVVAPGHEDIAPVGIPTVSVDEILADRDQLNQGGTMVTVGLSRILTPSNRVKLGQVFLRPRDGLRRVSVDRFLFVSEPWRAFWHMYAVGIPHRGYTDSFLAESRWRDALAAGDTDPFSADEILASIGDRLVLHRPPTLPALDVEWVEVTAGVHDDYASEKEAAFSEETSAAGIVRRLAAFAARVVPRRSVPAPSRLHAGPPFRGVRVVAADLPVDRWLVGRLRAVVDTTNRIAGAA